MSVGDEEPDRPRPPRDLLVDLPGGGVGIGLAQVEVVQVGEGARRFDWVDQRGDDRTARTKSASVLRYETYNLAT
jgi:hypothetical protein